MMANNDKYNGSQTIGTKNTIRFERESMEKGGNSNKEEMRRKEQSRNYKYTRKRKEKRVEGESIERERDRRFERGLVESRRWSGNERVTNNARFKKLFKKEESSDESNEKDERRNDLNNQEEVEIIFSKKFKRTKEMRENGETGKGSFHRLVSDNKRNEIKSLDDNVKTNKEGEVSHRTCFVCQIKGKKTVPPIENPRSNASYLIRNTRRRSQNEDDVAQKNSEDEIYVHSMRKESASLGCSECFKWVQEKSMQLNDSRKRSRVHRGSRVSGKGREKGRNSLVRLARVQIDKGEDGRGGLSSLLPSWMRDIGEKGDRGRGKGNLVFRGGTTGETLYERKIPGMGKNLKVDVEPAAEEFLKTFYNLSKAVIFRSEKKNKKNGIFNWITQFFK